ncbi:hypothetical protein [Winogradskyella ursingii]|uniref:hypothetical protein n=1 Tax=Winogradskyella ursingii TaxID=2686079 RepID=UPI0015C69FEE|nr:hypothetical protein [Winogradskyella ursingii]
MKLTFLVKFLAKRQRESKENHDKYVHFAWGYFINFIIIAISIVLFNQWVGLGICLIMVVALEYFQKKNGGTNTTKEQIIDILAGFITAPIWAWLLPFVF